MRRRSFLALLSAGTAGLAGCTSSCTNSYYIELTPVDGERVVSRSVLTVPETTDSYEHVVLRDLADAPEEPVVVLPRHTIPQDAVLRIDDAYYRVRREQLTREGYRVARDLALAADGTTPDVRYADLPRADREALLASGLGEALVSGSVEDRRAFVEQNTEDGTLDLTLRYLTPDPETPLATTEDLVVDVRGLALSLGLRRSERIDVDADRLTATEIGTTTESAVEAVLSVDGLRLEASSLSASERELLDAAVESEQRICLEGDEASPGTPTPTLSQPLREQLRRHDYVRYDGRWYTVEALEAIA
jgi:hypothetical protein